MSRADRSLIIHADDLGLARVVNDATFAALDANAVTSASLMVPGPAFEDAVEQARARGPLDLGIHLTITSEWPNCRWGPVAPCRRVSTLLAPDGAFWPDAVSACRHAAPAEVELEVRAQIDRATDAGIHPSHLDSHMFALIRSPALRAVLERVSADYGVPFFDPMSPGAGLDGTRPRLLLPALTTSTTPAEWTRRYCRAIAALAPGLTQLIVHCGHDTPALRSITGVARYDAAWRQRDTDTLVSDAFRAALRDARARLTRWSAPSVSHRPHGLRTR